MKYNNQKYQIPHSSGWIWRNVWMFPSLEQGLIGARKSQPPIAQLVERETVDHTQNQISLGRWFKSGSVDMILSIPYDSKNVTIWCWRWWKTAVDGLPTIKVYLSKMLVLKASFTKMNNRLYQMVEIPPKSCSIAYQMVEIPPKSCSIASVNSYLMIILLSMTGKVTFSCCYET